MKINDWLKQNGDFGYPEHSLYPGPRGRNRALIFRERLVCKDGFNMSVQANSGAYCEPRISLWPDNWGNGYSSVEIGFPSEREDLIMKYAEDFDDPTGTVYGYVPVEIVDKIIEKHGGIKN